MKRIYRKIRQHICWLKGKDSDFCKFFQNYERFSKGACKDCKHNPKNEVQHEVGHKEFW